MTYIVYNVATGSIIQPGGLWVSRHEIYAFNCMDKTVSYPAQSQNHLKVCFEGLYGAVCSFDGNYCQGASTFVELV